MPGRLVLLLLLLLLMVMMMMMMQLLLLRHRDSELDIARVGWSALSGDCGRIHDTRISVAHHIGCWTMRRSERFHEILMAIRKR
jgi:hypothetical protein